MIFNQFGFLFIFLPVVLTAFYLPGLVRWRKPLLLGASFIFYGISGVEHAVVLAVCIGWVFALTHAPRGQGDKKRLAAAVALPLASLVYYKYTGFLLRELIGVNQENGGEIFSLFTDILLPAGISFYTFQLVAFAVDWYRGRIRERTPLVDMALYVSFFPQLVAGPILRFGNVADHIRRLSAFQARSEDFAGGIGYLVVGLAAKVVLADTLGNYIAAMVTRPDGLSTVGCIYTVLAYSFQIYFDFFGYSLIAIGIGRFFGFHFPENFLCPYNSRNPKDFWRRWHVTLSFWIRDYVYLPLGGNRRYRLNIVIVFLVCGLWHGAGWTFICWGAYHALLVLAYHQTRTWWDGLPDMIQTSLTFGVVSLGWVFFLFDFDHLKAFWGSLWAGLAGAAVPNPSLEMWGALGLTALVCFRLDLDGIARACTAKGASHGFVRTTAMAAVFVFTLLFVDRSETFIYFRF